MPFNRCRMFYKILTLQGQCLLTSCYWSWLSITGRLTALTHSTNTQKNGKVQGTQWRSKEEDCRFTQTEKMQFPRSSVQTTVHKFDRICHYFVMLWKKTQTVTSRWKGMEQDVKEQPVNQQAQACLQLETAVTPVLLSTVMWNLCSCHGQAKCLLEKGFMGQMRLYETKMNYLATRGMFGGVTTFLKYYICCWAWSWSNTLQSCYGASGTRTLHEVIIKNST